MTSSQSRGRIPVPVPAAARLQTRDLPPALPSERLVVERVPAWKTATQVEPGDFLLSRAHGYRHELIKWGQGLRIVERDQRMYRNYTHAALVVSSGGDLIEAVGTGVRRSHLDAYVGEEYEIVHISASDEDRAQAVRVATAALGRRYNGLATVSIALWAFTGSPVIFFIDGAYTCSGLVARAMLAVGAVFSVDAAKVTPAQLAIYFNAPPPRAEPPSRRSLLRAGWRPAGTWPRRPGDRPGPS